MKIFIALMLLLVLQCLHSFVWAGDKNNRGGRRKRCRRNEDPEIVNCSGRGPRRHTRRNPPSNSIKEASLSIKFDSNEVLNNSGLACPTCDRLHCQYKESTLNCPGGVVLGVCGCCPRCAKQEDEECGGKDNYLGTCDRDLVCKDVSSSGRRSVASRPSLVPNPVEANVILNRGGRCQKGGFQEELSCKPECTPEYCSSHKSAICSARNIPTVSRECQTPCQHTSCKACFYQEIPKCKPCPKDNYKCMKSYAKCVKKFRYCRNEKHCKKKRKTTNLFRCWVPECP